MNIHSIAWWALLALVGTATATDIRWRRIPNWLVLPFLAAGVTVSTTIHGWAGLGQSLEGMALMTAVTGALCWIGGMGLGDLKLCAAVGAWIGPSQAVTALVVTGLAGGVLALIWAKVHGVLSESMDGSSELVAGFLSRGIHRHATLTLNNPAARTMPYAPAIAIGTVVSFFSN